MELVIALILARFIVNGTVDVTSMITGNQPPSKTYHDAKGNNKENGPLARMIKAWWADAIEDLDERHKARRLDSKEKKRLNREERQREKEAERQRLEEAKAQRKAERQRWIDEMNKRIADEQARQEKEAEGRRKKWKWPGGKGSEEVPPVGEWQPEEVPPVAGEEPEAASSDDDSHIFDADIVEEPSFPEGPEGPEIPDLKVIEGGRPDDDQEWSVYGKPRLYAVQEKGNEVNKPTQTVPGIDENGRSNIPQVVGEINGTKAGGTAMATMYEGKDQHGSATYTQGGSAVAIEGGITTHINWTAAAAEYQRRAATHAEIVGACMLQGDNGPERLALIAQIQEGHRQMAQAYDRINQILASDKAKIGDAYASTGYQAGSKVYVTEG